MQLLFVFSVFKNWLLRKLLCSVGLHGPKFGPGGKAANFCSRGCHHIFNQNAFKTWRVLLFSGEEIYVQAVSEYHARNMAIYGGLIKTDSYFKVCGEIFVHPENIRSIGEVH